jgi:hypothetical protein
VKSEEVVVVSVAVEVLLDVVVDEVGGAVDVLVEVVVDEEVLVGSLVVEVLEVVVELDVVSSSPPPPARAMTAITRPRMSAATSPIATFWPVLMPSSRSS